MKPLSLKCDANPKDYVTLTREGACAGLTVQEGRKVALVNLTAPQMREAAAWLNECAAEVEAMRGSRLRLVPSRAPEFVELDLFSGDDYAS